MEQPESSLAGAVEEMLGFGVLYGIERERGYNGLSYYVDFFPLRRMVGETGNFYSTSKEGIVLAVPIKFRNLMDKSQQATDGLMIIGPRDGTVPQGPGDLVSEPEVYILDTDGLLHAKPSKQFPDDLTLLPGFLNGQSQFDRHAFHSNSETAKQISRLLGAEVLDRFRWPGHDA